MSAPRIGPGSRREVGLLVSGFAHIAGRVTGTEPPAIFLTLGRQRRMFWGWLHFAGTLMPGGRLPRRETELVILRVATNCGSEYELTQHRRLGRRAGLTADEVERVQQPSLGGWSGHDALLLRAVDELHSRRDVGDDLWAELSTSYDEATLVELVMLVGHYEMLATTLGTLRVQPDSPRVRA